LTSVNVFSSLQLLPDTARNARLIGTAADMGKFGAATSKDMALYLATYFSLKDSLGNLSGGPVNTEFCVPWGERYSTCHVAVCYGDVDMLKRLLNGINSPNNQDKWGLSPLHLAARLQSFAEIDLIKALLESKPNLELVDQDGDTALHIAVSYAAADSVELILNAGANVNAQDKNGWTPLHRAIEQYSFNVVQLLLSKHADPTLTDSSGTSPLGLALENHDNLILKELINAVDSEGHPYSFKVNEKSAAES
jgi:ankyrin repeat protein